MKEARGMRDACWDAHRFVRTEVLARALASHLLNPCVLEDLVEVVGNLVLLASVL